MKQEKRAEVLVPTIMIVVLALASLITVVERGPHRLGLPVGASPLNAGKLGTNKMLSIIREEFNDVRVVRDWNVTSMSISSCDKVLIVTVSPEKSFTPEDLDSVDSIMRKCSVVLFLVADETGNANALLERARLSLRIDGRIISQLSSRPASITGSSSNVSVSPFVEALFSYPNGYVDKLYLDKASFISVSSEETNVSVLGVTTSYVMAMPSGPAGVSEAQTGHYLGRVVVAAFEKSGKYRALVISDGSIFTNQVLSNEVWGLKYERLLRESLNLLTNDTSGVVVLVDSSKYEYADLSTNPALLEYADPLTLSLYSVFRLIHPATWFPPLVSSVNDLISKLLSSLGFPLLSSLTLILGSLLAALLVRSAPEATRDKNVEEVKSREFVAFSNLVDEVISGKIKLGKQDFIELYEVVDEIFRSSVGVPLNSKEAISVLVSRGVDPRKAGSFWSSMNKTYLKAKKRFGFPPIIMWGRKVRRSIIECEEVLNTLGTSLFKDLGFEYLIAR